MTADKRILKPSVLLAPVPVVLVSCQTKDSRPNLLTIAWAGTVCSDPPMVSISIRPSRLSHELISQSGEFVINLVNDTLLKATDFCGVRSGRDLDKFAACQLDAILAEGMRFAPAVRQSPLTLSCRVRQCIPLGSHDCFLAEVVAVEADPVLFDQSDRLALEEAGLVAYSHGQYYALGRMLGFFGYSVAAPDVLSRRMAHRQVPDQPKQGRTSGRSNRRQTSRAPRRRKKTPGQSF